MMNLQKILDAIKKDLEFFFEILKNNNPKTIGGKLPDDGFYQ